MKTRNHRFSLRLWQPAALGCGSLGALFLSACLGGSGDASSSQQTAQLTEIVRALKAQLDGVKAEQAALQHKLASLEQGGPASAGGGGGGFPPALLPEETLAEGLEQAALEKRREVGAALKAKGLEVVGYGQPEITPPVEFTHPYRADIALTVSQGGRQFVAPLTFRADWQGQWQVEDTEKLVKLIIAAGQGGGPAPAAPPRFGGGSVATAPAAQPAPQQAQPAPPPPRPAASGPSVPGANVREIDLTGKEIFNR